MYLITLTVFTGIMVVAIGSLVSTHWLAEALANKFGADSWAATSFNAIVCLPILLSTMVWIITL